MFRLGFSLVILLNAISVFGQKVPSPVHWQFELVQNLDQSYKIIATAKIDNGWFLYSQFTADDGPIPTAFTIDDKVVPFEEKSTVITEMDEIFGVEVKKFKKESIFSYTIPNTDAKSVKGYVNFMTCDGTRCLPPVDVEFNIPLK